MLSAIQNVKLPPPPHPPSTAPHQNNSTESSVENTVIKQEQQQQSQSSNRVTDMSRRKQRNPKPIFNPNENEEQEAENAMR